MGPRHDQMCQTLSRYNWHNTQSKKARAERVQRHSLRPTTLETPRKWGSNPKPQRMCMVVHFHIVPPAINYQMKKEKGIFETKLSICIPHYLSGWGKFLCGAIWGVCGI